MKKFIYCMVLLIPMIAVLGPVIAAAESNSAVFPGNEAVSIAHGKRVVTYPPTTRGKWPAHTFLDKPSAAAITVDNKFFGSKTGGPLYMIEGANELLECSEPVVNDRVCRPSTLGKQKHAREWIVKLNSQWTYCHVPYRAEERKHNGYACMTDKRPGAAFVVVVEE